jgi:F0F1-type ATP synthase delta subunit
VKAKLPLSIYSSDQLGVLAWELEQAINELRKRSIRKTVAKGLNKNETPLETSKLLDELLKQSGVADFSQLDLEILLDNIKKMRESASSVSIILAATPNDSIKQQLVKWLRKEISPEVLCTFTTRADLCGGAIIRTNARQYDFSFRSKIVNNKQRISEIFNSAQ